MKWVSVQCSETPCRTIEHRLSPVARYEEQYPAFGDSREAKLIKVRGGGSIAAKLPPF